MMVLVQDSSETTETHGTEEDIAYVNSDTVMSKKRQNKLYPLQDATLLRVAQVI